MWYVYMFSHGEKIQRTVRGTNVRVHVYSWRNNTAHRAWYKCTCICFQIEKRYSASWCIYASICFQTERKNIAHRVLYCPSRHMTSIQRRLNVDATSWCCINVETTLYKRHVPAGVCTCKCLEWTVYLWVSAYILGEMCLSKQCGPLCKW